MTDLDLSRVLAILTQRIETLGQDVQASPWPADLFHRDDRGQVAAMPGRRFALVPTSTEPMTTPDAPNHPSRKQARNVTSTIELRWSATTPIDGGAQPYAEVLAFEVSLLDAATKPDGEPMRVLWDRATRLIQDTGWVVGTITLRVHHQIPARS